MDANTYNHDDALPRPKRTASYTPEEAIQVGLKMLRLKKVTPHGDFTNRIEQLGFNNSVARRFILVARRFSGPSNEPLLQAVDCFSKLIELLTLDDDEIEALKAGGEAHGITLQSLPSMTVKELRAALRGVAVARIDVSLSIAEARMLRDYREQAKAVQDVADKRAAPVWELRRDLFTNRCMVTL